MGRNEKSLDRIAPGSPHRIAANLGARVARQRCPILRVGNKIIPVGQA